MNSQRLEEIVAELMRPIGDLRHSFDTDLSALLEEYLTEAGLHALAADQSDDDSSGGEGGAGAGAGAGVVPNFAEVALLLQQSASIYGRKVDCLYQHVLSVSDSLHSSTLEMSNTTSRSSEPATPSAARRRRSAAAPLDFDYIPLEPCAGATREPGPLRPPPTLPRLFIELEPRAAIADGDVPLRDYDGEPIGLLSDFHCAWPLQHGKLVEELGGCEDRSLLRPIPLMELQAAIEANAPPSPPPLPRDDSPPPEPARASTPHPVPTPPPPPPPPEDMPPPPLPKRERKRKSDVNIADLIGGSIKLHITKELLCVLSRPQEFDGAGAWIPRVCGERERSLRALRAALQPHAGPLAGFDCFSKDTGGFCGWSTEEAAAAAAVVRDEGARRGRGGKRAGDDSDDDGFFEQSSLGDSDTSAAAAEKSDQEAAEWAAWWARVAARASAGQARAPLDVCGLAATVIQHLPEDTEKPFNEVLTEAAKDETDVSRLFLATLFLANAGNVEVVQGAPLSLNSLSLKLLSSDPRLFMAAAASDPVSAPPEPQTPSRTSAVNRTRQ